MCHACVKTLLFHKHNTVYCNMQLVSLRELVTFLYTLRLLKTTNIKFSKWLIWGRNNGAGVQQACPAVNVSNCKCHEISVIDYYWMACYKCFITLTYLPGFDCCDISWGFMGSIKPPVSNPWKTQFQMYLSIKLPTSPMSHKAAEKNKWHWKLTVNIFHPLNPPSFHFIQISTKQSFTQVFILSFPSATVFHILRLPLYSCIAAESWGWKQIEKRRDVGGEESQKETIERDGRSAVLSTGMFTRAGQSVTGDGQA